MSEESTDSEDNGFTVHKPEYRSEGKYTHYYNMDIHKKLSKYI